MTLVARVASFFKAIPASQTVGDKDKFKQRFLINRYLLFWFQI